MDMNIKIKLHGLIGDIKGAKGDFHRDLKTSYQPTEVIAESVTAVLNRAIEDLEAIEANN